MNKANRLRGGSPDKRRIFGWCGRGHGVKEGEDYAIYGRGVFEEGDNDDEHRGLQNQAREKRYKWDDRL